MLMRTMCGRPIGMLVIATMVMSAAPVTADQSSDSPARPSDAAFVKVIHVRGFVRWQPVEHSAWQIVKSGQRLPSQGKVAVGLGAVLKMDHHNRLHTFYDSGIYSLATTHLTYHTNRPNDPPGIKSLRRLKADKEQNQHKSVAIVTATRGLVQWRAKENQSWKKIILNTRLPLGAEVRVGLRSFVVVAMGDKSVTIDRLGMVKITESIKDGVVQRSSVGIKYGRTHYRVQAAGEEHESKIHAPSQTLSAWGMFPVMRNGELYMECRRLTPKEIEAMRAKRKADDKPGEKRSDSRSSSSPATITLRGQPIVFPDDSDRPSLLQLNDGRTEKKDPSGKSDVETSFRPYVPLSIEPTLDGLMKAMGLQAENERE